MQLENQKRSIECSKLTKRYSFNYHFTFIFLEYRRKSAKHTGLVSFGLWRKIFVTLNHLSLIGFNKTWWKHDRIQDRDQSKV